MKFCSHCGAQCKDSAIFCTTCGNKLNEGVPPQPDVPPQQNVPPQQSVPPQYGAPPQYSMPPKPVASTNRTPLLQMIESPALLVVAILLSASVVLTFINVCMSNWPSIFTMLPGVLGLVGLWMLFVSAQGTRTQGTPLSLGSFSLFKASMIVSIVATAIYLLIVDILLIIAMAGISEIMHYGYSGYGVIIAVLVIMFLLITAYEVLAILYYAKGMRVVTDIRIALETGQPVRPLSKYFIVVSFILGIGSALGGLAMLIIACIAHDSLRYYYYGISIAPAVIAFLAALASAGFYIMIGVSLSKLSRPHIVYPPNHI